jgi:hypothetical protein
MQKAKAVTLAFASEPFPARGGSDQIIFTTQVQVCHDLRLVLLVFVMPFGRKNRHHV